MITVLFIGIIIISPRKLSDRLVDFVIFAMVHKLVNTTCNKAAANGKILGHYSYFELSLICSFYTEFYFVTVRGDIEQSK